VLSRIFDPTGEEVTVRQRIFMDFTSRQILAFNSKSNETGGTFAYVGGQRNLYKIFWCENVKEIGLFEDRGS